MQLDIILDNVATVLVSLLVLYHLAMVYNSWGEANYIFWGKDLKMSEQRDYGGTDWLEKSVKMN